MSYIKRGSLYLHRAFWLALILIAFFVMIEFYQKKPVNYVKSLEIAIPIYSIKRRRIELLIIYRGMCL
jgi:hypothetical protein